MQISITDDSGSDVLVHGPARATAAYAAGPIGDVEFSDEALVQVAARLRSATRSVYNRGNVVATVQFSALRQFASTMAAKQWLAAHMLGVRRAHKLVLTEGAATLSLTGGALGAIKAQPSGVELLVTYTFTFSGVTSS